MARVEAAVLLTSHILSFPALGVVCEQAVSFVDGNYTCRWYGQASATAGQAANQCHTARAHCDLREGSLRALHVQLLYLSDKLKTTLAGIGHICMFIQTRLFRFSFPFYAAPCRPESARP